MAPLLKIPPWRVLLVTRIVVVQFVCRVTKPKSRSYDTIGLSFIKSLDELFPSVRGKENTPSAETHHSLAKTRPLHKVSVHTRC